MQVLFKNMITKFLDAYQVNGIPKAQFAKTNFSLMDDELENLYTYLNISNVVDPDNEDVASFIGTNFNILYNWPFSGTILGFYGNQQKTIDEYISVFYGEGDVGWFDPIKQHRSPQSIVRTADHELAHYGGMQHVPSELIDELKTYGVCSLFAADSRICTDLFELSIFDLYYLRKIAENAADLSFIPPKKHYVDDSKEHKLSSSFLAVYGTAGVLIVALISVAIFHILENCSGVVTELPVEDRINTNSDGAGDSNLENISEATDENTNTNVTESRPKASTTLVKREPKTNSVSSGTAYAI